MMVAVKKLRVAAGLMAALLLGAGTAHALTSVDAGVPSATPNTSTAVSPWLALAALSHPVETPGRLCYWDYRDERWIPADTQLSAERIKDDPRPVFREAGFGPGRCRGGIPAADIGALGAVLSTFVYIAAEKKDGSFQRESISPS